jgi:hypothetical protein
LRDDLLSIARAYPALDRLSDRPVGPVEFRVPVTQGDWYGSIVRCSNLIDGEWWVTSGHVVQIRTIIDSDHKRERVPTLADAREYLEMLRQSEQLNPVDSPVLALLY